MAEIELMWHKNMEIKIFYSLKDSNEMVIHQF